MRSVEVAMRVDRRAAISQARGRHEDSAGCDPGAEARAPEHETGEIAPDG